MEGAVVLTRDDNVVRGQRLEVDLVSGRSRMFAAVPSAEGGTPPQRVRALFTPEAAEPAVAPPISPLQLAKTAPSSSAHGAASHLPRSGICREPTATKRRRGPGSSPRPPAWRRATWASGSRRVWCCATSISGCGAARPSGCWAPMAPARRPAFTSSPASSRPIRARSVWTAWTSPICRCTSAPAWGSAICRRRPRSSAA